MDKSDFLTTYASHLNEKQIRAIQTVQGPVLLLAVPGSGKTTVLVNRLGYMLFCENIAPENILTLTYTVAATNDMAQRFKSIFGDRYANVLEFRTINGICAKIISYYAQMIGKPSFELVTDEKVTGKILTDILVKNMNEYPTESDVKMAKTLITYSKNMLLTEDEIEKIGKEEGIPLVDIFREYNSYLRSNSLMDYDDQMIYAYRLLKGVPELLHFYQGKYRYICVDEAQDTSKIQHIIISLLAGRDGNLFMVGDEDQSIYGFRAAYPEALLNFEKEHPGAKVLIMDQNYRSNAKIVAAADSFIQHNKARHAKHMLSTREEASEIDYIQLTNRSNQYSYLLKVAKNCERETAVLYRENESALPLIDLMERQNIPFRIKSVDMAFFTHRVVADVTNILHFALNPYDTDLFMKIYFKCQTYLKKKQAESLCRISLERNIPVLEAVDYVDGINGRILGQCRSFATHLRNMLTETPTKALFRIEIPLGYREYLERNKIDDNKLFILKMLATNETSVFGFLDRLVYLQDMLKNREGGKSNFIMSTIHSSKGLEYDQVYLMDVCDGVFPNQVIHGGNASLQEKKAFEEERRLFYVGMTRAKNDLHIFKFSNKSSQFVKEIQGNTKRLYRKNNAKTIDVSGNSSKQNGKRVRPKGPKTEKIQEEMTVYLPSDFELVIGERVVQKRYGAGVISDVDYNENGQADKFIVTFDSGEERAFIYPIAFKMGMRIGE